MLEVWKILAVQILLMGAPFAIWSILHYRSWRKVYPRGNIISYQFRHFTGQKIESDRFPKVFLRVAFVVFWVFVGPLIVFGA